MAVCEHSQRIVAKLDRVDREPLFSRAHFAGTRAFLLILDDENLHWARMIPA